MIKANAQKKQEKEIFNWYILFIISLTSIMTGIYRDGFASLFPFLQKDFNLTRAQLGLHSTFFSSASAFFAIYTGRLADVKGSKWSLVFSCLIMGIFYIIHSIAPNFSVVLLITALTGITVSFNSPAVNKAIVEWFPQKQRSTAIGLQSMAIPIGGLLGAIVLPSLGSIFGWRKTVILPGMVTIFCALFLSYSYKEKKINSNLVEINNSSLPFWECITNLIKNVDLIKVSSYGFFLGMMANSINAHFSLFLFLDYGLPETVAGVGLAIVQLGSFLGRVVWGIFCDKILEADKGKTFLYMGILFWLNTMFLSLGLRNSNPHVNLLYLLAFLAGCLGKGWLGIYYASVTETVKEENVGIAIGLGCLFMRLGMMVAPPIFGYIADLRGSYNLSWFLLGIIMLSSSLLQYLSSRKKCD